LVKSAVNLVEPPVYIREPLIDVREASVHMCAQIAQTSVIDKDADQHRQHRRERRDHQAQDLGIFHLEAA
jgi:hypothetical protein